jgi:hypothetical protein
MRCLVDKTVLNAEVYFKTYGREPSPAGDITVSSSDLSALDDIDLKTVLTEMKTLGGKGELLVVTHSNPDGLKMPLVAGGKSAGAGLKVMGTILQISSGISQREAIRSLSGNKKFKAWQSWFKTFDPGVKLDDSAETNPDWESFAESQFDSWHDRQGKQILKLPNPKQDLADLISLVDAVRKAGFARLEFRACRIGTDKDSLKTVANFFNAKKVVAPKEVRTFYGSIPKVTIINDKDFAAKSKSSTARKFPDCKVLFEIGDTTFTAFATSDSEIKTFIKNYIHSGYAGTITPFRMGGLEPAGKAVIAGKKHVFPLEKDYLTLLGSFDAAAAATASGTP